MPMSFACKACGKRVTVSRKAQGQKGQCGHCRAETIVPTLPADESVSLSASDDRPAPVAVLGARPVPLAAAQPSTVALAPAPPEASALDAAPPATSALDHSLVEGARSAVSDHVLEQAARIQMDLERQKLEIEREKLLLERQKLDLDRQRAAATAPRADEEARPGSGVRHRPPGRASDERARVTRARPPAERSKASSLALILAVSGVAGGVTVLAAVRLSAPERPSVAGAGSVSEPPEVAALRLKAEAGDGEACLSLGLFLWNGVGVERDPEAARAWLERASARGDARVSAEAVVALDRIRTLEREQRQQVIQLAELQADRARRAAAEQARAREAEERRRRAEEEQAAAAERERAARRDRRVAELTATALALRERLSSPVLPPVLRVGLRDLEALLADPEADPRVRALAQEARERAEFNRLPSIDLGVAEARRLAAERSYGEAIAMLAEVEAVQGVLSEALKGERLRWKALEQEPVETAGGEAAAPDAADLGAEPSAASPFACRIPQRRAGLLARGGGSQATEAAVQAGLRWLARHQAEDGGWACEGYGALCEGARCSGPGAGEFDVGVTGLALLAMLGAGHTHLTTATYDDPITRRTMSFGKVVRKGLDSLVARQDGNGCLGRQTGEYMYNHAIGALALAEAYGLTGAPVYKEPAQRAIDFLVDAQNAGFGWRYTVRPGSSDTSVTGWAVMALKAAHASGLITPRAAFDGARAWFDRVTDAAGLVGYTAAGVVDVFVPGKNDAWGSHPSMTAIGLLSRIYLDPDQRGATLAKSSKIVGDDKPVWDERGHKIDSYYWYYGTLALFLSQEGGAPASWRPWNEALKSALVPSQRARRNDCADGSWPPEVDRWGFAGGRVYMTAINTMSLEVYYRYEASAATPPRGGADKPAAAEGPVEAEVRRRFATWTRVRGLSLLRCDKCQGKGAVKCSGCGGDRITEVQTPRGLVGEWCDKCTDGTERCPDGQCLEGFNTQSLRTAFWGSLSPEGKRGKDWQVVLRQLVRGELGDLVGPTLVVRSAEVRSVEVLADRARVTATVAWGTGEAGAPGAAGEARKPSTWTTEWVRYKGVYYLATEADVQPDALR